MANTHCYSVVWKQDGMGPFLCHYNGFSQFPLLVVSSQFGLRHGNDWVQDTHVNPGCKGGRSTAPGLLCFLLTCPRKLEPPGVHALYHSMGLFQAAWWTVTHLLLVTQSHQQWDLWTMAPLWMCYDLTEPFPDSINLCYTVINKDKCRQQLFNSVQIHSISKSSDTDSTKQEKL